MLAIDAVSAYIRAIIGSGPYGSRRRWLRAPSCSRLLQRESTMGASHPNRFLASLDSNDLDLLLPQLKPFELVHEDLLFAAGDRVNWVYLPHSGAISLVVGLADGQLIE